MDILNVESYYPKNVFTARDEFFYNIRINGFSEPKKLCFSFELYPEYNSVAKERHLGYFNHFFKIPKEGLNITVSLKYPEVNFIVNGSRIKPSDVWVGGFKEDCMYDVHFTLAQIEGGKSHELVRKKLKQFIVFSEKETIKSILMKEWSGKDRRLPTKYTVDFLTQNHLTKMLVETLSNLNINENKKDLKVLDVGCGGKPYYPFFYGLAKEYIGLDIEKTSFSDVVSAAEQIPFPDETFDFVLCSQVLEHVINPFKSAAEIMRVTKKGGTIFVTAPFTWGLHNYPVDYWRFSPDGLKTLFKGVSEAKVFQSGNSVQCLIERVNAIINLRVNSVFIKNKVFAINNFLIKRAAFFKEESLPSNCILVAKK